MERMSSNEFTYWLAFYELQARDEKKTLEDIKRSGT